NLPSDISPEVETMMIAFFYFIGSVSLVVNLVTLFLIIRHSSALMREVWILSIVQQVACLSTNGFFTLLFIPFVYPSAAGAGYCVGILCLSLPYPIIMVV
ncbi:hypothetical protein PMAYCL1PPCAC_05799, partial [Pristionchus mayeri]